MSLLNVRLPLPASCRYLYTLKVWISTLYKSFDKVFDFDIESQHEATIWIWRQNGKEVCHANQIDRRRTSIWDNWPCQRSTSRNSWRARVRAATWERRIRMSGIDSRSKKTDWYAKKGYWLDEGRKAILLQVILFWPWWLIVDGDNNDRRCSWYWWYSIWCTVFTACRMGKANNLLEPSCLTVLL